MTMMMITTKKKINMVNETNRETLENSFFFSIEQFSCFVIFYFLFSDVVAQDIFVFPPPLLLFVILLKINSI